MAALARSLKQQGDVVLSNEVIAYFVAGAGAAAAPAAAPAAAAPTAASASAPVNPAAKKLAAEKGLILQASPVPAKMAVC